MGRAKDVTACKGRWAGCAGQAERGRLMCDNCRLIHNQREAERRAARKDKGLCVVCGAKASKSGSHVLTHCKAHREYYNDRAREKGLEP